MLCNQCHERQATIHITQVVGDKLAKRDLCEVCGKEFVDAAKSGMTNSFESLIRGSPLQIPYELMLASDSRYTQEAYDFVRAGLERAQQNRLRRSQTVPAHISGAELLEGLRELAIESFGKRAKATLNGWGIFKCEDFGEIVFNLVAADLLSKQEKDTKTDFQGGYNFDTAFPS
ncbi:MAG TPA: Minf_1886 family protein [Verrucomicrobiae bacterium]|nr:Minf_1886 family protein [Verrucomicrobiae bacterium]